MCKELHQVQQEDTLVLIFGIPLVFYEYLKDSNLNLPAPGEGQSFLECSPTVLFFFS